LKKLTFKMVNVT